MSFNMFAFHCFNLRYGKNFKKPLKLKALRNVYFPLTDSMEVKTITTRKLRRRPNDPTPIPEKRRKPSPDILFECIWLKRPVMVSDGVGNLGSFSVDLIAFEEGRWGDF